MRPASVCEIADIDLKRLLDVYKLCAVNICCNVYDVEKKKKKEEEIHI